MNHVFFLFHQRCVTSDAVSVTKHCGLIAHFYRILSHVMRVSREDELEFMVQCSPTLPDLNRTSVLIAWRGLKVCICLFCIFHYLRSNLQHSVVEQLFYGIFILQCVYKYSNCEQQFIFCRQLIEVVPYSQYYYHTWILRQTTIQFATQITFLCLCFFDFIKVFHIFFF